MIGLVTNICLLLAFIFLLLATLGYPSRPRWNWLSAGLLFWLLGEHVVPMIARAIGA